jgi:hypothetical protein
MKEKDLSVGFHMKINWHEKDFPWSTFPTSVVKPKKRNHLFTIYASIRTKIALLKNYHLQK